MLVVVCFIGRSSLAVEHPGRTSQQQTQRTNFEEYLTNITFDDRSGNADNSSSHVAPPTSVTELDDGEDEPDVDPSPVHRETNSTPPRQSTPESIDQSGGHRSVKSSGDQLLNYFKAVPRQHWSCCMLGILAGNKGFHCQSEFYAERLAPRNYNRAHNGRTPMHGSAASNTGSAASNTGSAAAGPGGSRRRRWGYDIMRTFRRCVVNEAVEFHRCCHTAAIERSELLKVDQIYSHQPQNSSS